MTPRATMSEEGFPFLVYVDDVIVGKSTEIECKALMDELNASDRKCDLLKKIMEMDEQSAAKQKRPEWALDGYGHDLADTNTDG